MQTKINCKTYNVTFNYEIVGNLLKTSVTGKGFNRRDLYRIAVHHNYDCGVETDYSTSLIVNPITNDLERCNDASALKGAYYNNFSNDEQTIQIFEKLK